MLPFPPISTQIEGRPSTLSDADDPINEPGCLEGRDITFRPDWSIPLFAFTAFSGAIGVTSGSTLIGLNRGEHSFNRLLVGSSVIIMMISLLAIWRIKKIQVPSREESLPMQQQKLLIEKQGLLIEKQSTVIKRQEEDLAKYERQTQQLKASHIIRQQLHQQIQKLDNHLV